MKQLLWPTLFLSLLQGCGAGISDYTEDLGNGYTYESFGTNSHMIRVPQKKHESIYGNVISHTFDSNFILAIQKPNKESHKICLADNIRFNNIKEYPENSELDMRETERIADSIIKHDPNYQKIFANKMNYWIISHKSKQLYGPLTEQEYLLKRKELKIPDGLQLDTIQEND